ncbi:hypothetical protein BV25DRAFT_1903857 [Artomyces pyxidatus]|uniref:Uncharacterized protein n=1 Tax=Artomyces pyxidatus TaxID=48021 RepID=A0ACB8SFP2_9AGAM|nr:hypothetical protein BV25DRAFT_1903857 [Artomyces pyxidatus]
MGLSMFFGQEAPSIDLSDEAVNRRAGYYLTGLGTMAADSVSVNMPHRAAGSSSTSESDVHRGYDLTPSMFYNGPMAGQSHSTSGEGRRGPYAVPRCWLVGEDGTGQDYLPMLPCRRLNEWSIGIGCPFFISSREFFRALEETRSHPSGQCPWGYSSDEMAFVATAHGTDRTACLFREMCTYQISVQRASEDERRQGKEHPRHWKAGGTGSYSTVRYFNGSRDCFGR